MSIQRQVNQICDLLTRMGNDMHESVTSCGCCGKEDRDKTIKLIIESSTMIANLKGR